MRRIYLTLFVSLLITTLCNGQNQDWRVDSTNFGFTVYSVEDGLSQSLVSDLAMDSAGYLWIGTKDGLNRFDGKNFHIYRNDTESDFSLPGNYIEDILIDSDHRIWISTNAAGLCLYDPMVDAFIPVVETNGNPIEKSGNIDITKNGEILIRTEDLKYGYVLVPNDIKETDNEGFIRVKKVQITDYYHGLKAWSFCSESNPERFDRSFHYGQGERLYFLDPSGQIIHMDRDALLGRKDPTYIKLPRNFNLDRDTIFFFENLHNGEIFGHFDGRHIYRIDSGLGEMVHWHSLSQGRAIDKYHIFDKRGRAWIRMKDGNYQRVNAERQHTEIITCGSAFDLMIPHSTDFRGNIWFRSSGGGLGKLGFEQEQFKRISSANSVSASIWNYRFEVPDNKSLMDDSLYQMWMNPKNEKLILAKASRTEANQSHPFIDSEGKIWLAWKYPNGENKTVTAHPRNTDEEITPANNTGKELSDLPCETIFSWKGDTAVLLRRTENNVVLDLCHTESGIVNRIESPRFDKIGISRFVNDWYVDYPDGIWLATLEGLFYWDYQSKLWEWYQRSSIGKLRLYSICPDPIQGEKYLWLGSDNGLFRFDRKTKNFKEFTTKDGLPNNLIYGILPDENENIWLSTNYGLCKFGVRTFTTRNFTAEDGINGTEFNRFQYSRSTDGALYFGGISGVTKFDPNVFQQKKNPSKLVLNELRLFNKPVLFNRRNVDQTKGFQLTDPIELANDLKFSYDESMITFRFGLIDHGPAHNQVYKYRLLGNDNTWIEAGKLEEATYTNLAPKHYTFEVIGKNSDGIWTPTPTRLAFEVLPPWWATWWFRSIAILVFAAMAYAFYRYRINSILRVERMRNQIAQDLHDEIGSTLSSISLYSAVMKSNEGALSPKSKPILDRIITNVSSIMEKMNDMVWTIKSDNDGMDQVVNRMRSFAVEMAEARGMRLVFDSEPAVEKMKLDMNRRKEVYLIFKEAVNNAVKYSQATELLVGLQNSSGILSISISDNGTGFDVDRPSQRSFGGNGIPGMKKRAERINAIFEIRSNEDSGTEIILQVPINH